MSDHSLHKHSNWTISVIIDTGRCKNQPGVMVKIHFPSANLQEFFCAHLFSSLIRFSAQSLVWNCFNKVILKHLIMDFFSFAFCLNKRIESWSICHTWFFMFIKNDWDTWNNFAFNSSRCYDLYLQRLCDLSTAQLQLQSTEVTSACFFLLCLAMPGK